MGSRGIAKRARTAGALLALVAGSLCTAGPASALAPLPAGTPGSVHSYAVSPATGQIVQVWFDDDHDGDADTTGNLANPNNGMSAEILRAYESGESICYTIDYGGHLSSWKRGGC